MTWYRDLSPVLAEGVHGIAFPVAGDAPGASVSYPEAGHGPASTSKTHPSGSGATRPSRRWCGAIRRRPAAGRGRGRVRRPAPGPRRLAGRPAGAGRRRHHARLQRGLSGRLRGLLPGAHQSRQRRRRGPVRRDRTRRRRSGDGRGLPGVAARGRVYRRPAHAWLWSQAVTPATSAGTPSIRCPCRWTPFELSTGATVPAALLPQLLLRAAFRMGWAGSLSRARRIRAWRRPWTGGAHAGTTPPARAGRDRRGQAPVCGASAILVARRRRRGNQSSACGPCARGMVDARTGWRDGSFLTGLLPDVTTGLGLRGWPRRGLDQAWAKTAAAFSNSPDAVLSAVI